MKAALVLLHLPFPESQAALALFIFLFSFAYEDGATLLAATLGAAGCLDVRFAFASAFLGIWIGDMGLYAVGATLGRKAAALPWLRRFVALDSLAKAEAWFQRRGPFTIVMSRFLPGSRLPLYVAAGALKLPAKLFGAITGICSALWVGAILSVLHFAPGLSLAYGKRTLWLLAAMLAGPWLASKVAIRAFQRVRGRTEIQCAR